MSLATCKECEAFINTDEDHEACVDDDFICESCREDEAIDLYLHETAEYQCKLINELRKQNEFYKTALENIAFAKSWTVQNKPYELVAAALLGLGKLSTYEMMADMPLKDQ